MAKIFVVYHSGFGHTKIQAEAVLSGVKKVPGVEAMLLTSAEATARMDDLDSADGIIFGCPTYMGSMSAEMKKFVEASSKKWFTQAWKDKVAGAFTNSSNFAGDKMTTLFGLMVNAMQHGMIYVGTGVLPAFNDQEGQKTVEGPGPDAINRVSSSIGPMSSSFQMKAPEAPGKGDLDTAEGYGQRVAEITVQFLRGKK